MGERPSLLAPQVDRYLLADEGEEIVDEVLKHPITLVIPIAQVIAGVLLMALSGLAGAWWWVVVLVALALALAGLYSYHARFMDRFVITNMRVFRVKGIFFRQVSTMPLIRILDINVRQPFLGMIFDYGHFTFESAADDQGLRDITYVADSRGRDLTIQRVIQRAGIRQVADTGTGRTDDGT